MRYPVNNPVVRAAFGIRPWPVTGTHTGTDYVAPTGTPLYPIRNGVVSWTQTGHPTMGNVVEIDIGGGLFTRYLHLNVIRVSRGQAVSESTVVGDAGFSGYVEPAGPAGAHLHAELYTKSGGQPSGFMDIHAYIANNGGGNTMAERISIDTDRILQHGILGRNGIGGRTQALNGSTGKVFEGQELTNANVQAWFLSQEGRLWRDSWDPWSINDVNQRIASIPVKDEQLRRYTAEVEKLNKQVSDLTTKLLAEENKNTELTIQLETAQNDLKEANETIKDLETQLAANDCPDITINFNFFGQLLWSLLKAFGTNKKG